ncbi:BREX-2 system adenine-specific DNA-methyltransferase PglX [Streptomyces sp. NPDC085524]|uniref:BREX-2 system adenine-specific DNA-methyltransferase PglX n=1 Tax=Streptomyces sp. NPDC085524 TaxID=3365728 RepID=UPI0037D54292
MDRYAVAERGNGCDEGKAPLVDKAALLKDLQKQVGILEDDLRGRTDSVEEFHRALRSEYESAYGAQRTAATYETWRDERVTQVAAAWVLACVFVRFCEDNGLVPDAWLSGPGERLAEAEDRHAEYFRTNPEHNDRDWLTASFKALAESNPTVAGLFDREHNPLWELDPGYEAASGLLAFWRERGADGEIRYDFTDAELDTRFLGDLYQDLSEHARKTYALLQTPEFVEEFILDLTLEPAVEEFGLDPVWKHKPAGWTGEDPIARGLRCIDPACGSGHFLLGMFERLLAKWREAEPGTDGWVLVRRALDSVHGADKNPFAAAIARFRLLVAALKACGVRELRRAPELPIHVAVGDSLLHGRGAETVTESLDTLFGEADGRTFAYRTEDVWEYADRVDLLGRGSYHVVVANPPYIGVDDDRERENYRASYGSCRGEYFLTIPFAERIFGLAIRGAGVEAAGFTGQITGNSFIKQKFGAKLVEEFLPTVLVTHVIDLSGIQIQGHGTPTVVLVGQNVFPRREQKVKVTFGLRDEPGRTLDPTKGVVWPEIVANRDRPGYSSEWIGVSEFSRSRLGKHPWVLAGGSAISLMDSMEVASSSTVRSMAIRCGFYGDTHADEAFTLPASGYFARQARAKMHGQVAHRGEHVRDWGVRGAEVMLVPYDALKGLLPHDSLSREFVKYLWPLRTDLWGRTAFQGGTYRSAGREWWEWHQLPKDEKAHPWAIVHAEVSTHNHFYLDRSERVLNRSAPITKLSKDASPEDHVSLVGLLNSSAACFWLRQVNQPKSGSGLGRGVQDEEWEERYGFRSGNVKKFPLPVRLPLELGSHLDLLAQELAALGPAIAVASGRPTRVSLAEARVAHTRVRASMVSLQEELDWFVYGAYNLLGAPDMARVSFPDHSAVPGISVGERAFEIVLARRVAAGEVESAWFDRHGSTPITEIPDHWPDAYKAVVQARIELIESHEDIGLIERPEYKRRWASETWEKKENAALRTWLLDACEREDLWFATREGFRQPRTLTISQLADFLRNDEDVQSVAALYAGDHLGKRDASLATVLADVIAAEHVPYLASLRYKDSGLRKRSQWEKTWDLQREEDRTGQRLEIAVPPKYTSADFLKQSYWSHRGKLDVPKERFISYPDAGPDSDPTILLGWAGWDHKDQAQALINLVNDRTDESGWETERITPLLAGLQEVMPWVHQWHGEFDEEWDGTPSEEYQAYLDEQRAKHGLSVDDLTAWRPEKKARGGRRKAE